jgi:hypothetical protein
MTKDAEFQVKITGTCMIPDHSQKNQTSKKETFTLYLTAESKAEVTNLSYKDKLDIFFNCNPGEAASDIQFNTVEVQ